MKKWLIWALAAVMTLGLIGCGDKPTEAPSSGASSEAPSESATEAAGLDDKKYSDFLTEDGYIIDVVAKDCVSNVDFSTLTASKTDLETEAKDQAEGYLDYVAQHFAVEVRDREVRNGDKVNIDYSGSIDGVKFDGGTAAGAEVTAGSQEFIDDFLTQIIGHMPGETMDVNVSFPDPYPNNTELSGKPALFVVTINFIKEAPELTDAFVAENRSAIEEYTNFENLTDLAALQKAAYDYFYDYELENVLYGLLRDYDAVTKIPENAYNYGYVILNQNYVSNYGVTLTDLKAYGYDEAKIKSMVEDEARIEILLQVLYEEEQFHVTEADFKEATHTDENAKFIETYGKGYLSRFVMFDRAMSILKGKIQIK